MNLLLVNNATVQTNSLQKYNFVWIDLSWKDVGYLSAVLADAYCYDQFGTGLVSWHNEDEYQSLKVEIEKRCTHNTVRFWSDCKAYVGLIKNNEGNWIWKDGTNCTYSGTKNGMILCVDKWHPEQPDNAFGNEMCVEISRTGELNDINCNIPYRWDDGFFCAISKHYTPSPTSMDAVPVNIDRLIILNNTIYNTINNTKNNTINNTMDQINISFPFNITDANLNRNDSNMNTISNNYANQGDAHQHTGMVIAVSIVSVIVLCLLIVLIWMVKKYCCKKEKNIDEPDSSRSTICKFSYTDSAVYAYCPYPHKDAEEQLSD